MMPARQPAAEGRSRVVIAAIRPEIDAGRFPIKRTVGDEVAVEASIFCDGHDLLAAVLRFRRAEEERWQERRMTPAGNDCWRASFPVVAEGRYVYTARAWVDEFATWREGLRAKAGAGRDVTVDLLVGADIVGRAAGRADGDDAAELRRRASAIVAGSPEDGVREALAPALVGLMESHPDTRLASSYPRELEVTVDRERARFSSWYELFPRSCAAEPGRHGTISDCAGRLAAVAAMGFDVLYLPPIHPIGRRFRRGPNNTPGAGPDAVGSPWAIGAEEGGHTAIHPRLGTLADFRALVARAHELGIEVALDLAFQCSPDHPWVSEHPEWFRHRPDGSIQHAENPPKRYEDIVPLDFESDDWRGLWQALAEVTVFWIEQGVRIFRVDNPHTKPFAFWEWLITEVKAAHPEVLFLAEAFTRPAVMQRLAKLGFTQSYTYFAWRNGKHELTSYMEELLRPEVADALRPNFWPNTPDILTEYLQTGGRPAFIVRVVLAATLAASYGIYGPAFELCEDRAREPGSEEYLDSEKYQIRHWNLDDPDSLRPIVTRLNRARHELAALQRNDTLHFHQVDNEMILCYSKRATAGGSTVLVVLNLDPHHAQSGWVELDLDELGVGEGRPFQVHDRLGEARFLWHGSRNYVELDPRVMPAHLFVVRHRVRTEHDFEYFL